MVAVWTVVQTLPIHVHAEHVTGHQDTKTHRPLTHLEKLNVEMDALAKSFWIHLVTSAPGMPAAPTPDIQHEGWQLWDGTTKISRPSLKHLYRLLYTPITLSWWR